MKTRKVFSHLGDLLTLRGYSKKKTRGQSYFVWRLPNSFVLYNFTGKLGENKIFIDAEHTDLYNLLTQVKGVIPPDQGITKNNKFEEFKAKKINPHTGITEYEGWKFQFLDSNAANAFLDICEEYDNGGIQSAIEKSKAFELITTKETGRNTTIKARVGQQQFKKKLFGYWRCCAVTGCTVLPMLRASHIKPWSKSTDIERLDHFNGLLLLPNLDALFDAGYITFLENGKIEISKILPPNEYQAFGISDSMRLRKLNPAHIPYLKYHNNFIFNN